MKKIAVLVSDNLLPGADNARADAFELDEEMAKLVPAFAQHNMDLHQLRWREAADHAEDYDAMLPLLVWDYFEQNQIEFMSQMAKVDGRTKLLNPFDVIRWNASKSYLDDLKRRGAPVIPTVVLDRVTQTGVRKAFETLGTETLVIKPLIGGGAWRQVLFEQGAEFPARSELPPEGALVQPFLPSVREEGEYSFLYFGGQFSHALIKRPKSGDYRVQSIFGGTEESYTPTTAERAIARTILEALDFTPLYARIDLLRGQDGALKLIEMELIEPYLYLSHAPGEGGENKGAQKLAESLVRRLG